jgi:hypothetical protein
MGLEKPGELHNLVHHRGFAMVNMGDDGNIAQSSIRMGVHIGGLRNGSG